VLLTKKKESAEYLTVSSAYQDRQINRARRPWDQNLGEDGGKGVTVCRPLTKVKRRKKGSGAMYQGFFAGRGEAHERLEEPSDYRVTSSLDKMESEENRGPEVAWERERGSRSGKDTRSSLGCGDREPSCLYEEREKRVEKRLPNARRESPREGSEKSTGTKNQEGSPGEMGAPPMP